MARVFLVCLWMLLAVALPGTAGAVERTVLKPQPCVILDKGAVTPPIPTDRLDCQPQQTVHGSGDFRVWVGGFLVRSQPDDPLVLRTGSVWQDSVTLDIYYADGHVASTGSTSATTSLRLQPGALIQYDIPPHDEPIVGLLAGVKGSANVRGILLDPQIMPKSVAAERDVLLVAIYAGFAGLFIALLCYNFVLWTVMRSRFQLAYCAMVLAMCGYLFSSSGALAGVFPGIDNNDRLRLNYMLLTLVGVSAIAFARYYFEARVFPRWFVRATPWVMGTLIATTSAFVLLAPASIWLLDRINALAFAALLLWVFPIIYFAIVGRSRFVGIFLVAWTVPIVFALVRVLSNIGLVSQRFWIDNSTLLTLGAEALLSAIAIAYRVRVLSDERDRARAAENVARLLSDTDPLTGVHNRRAFLAKVIGDPAPQRLLLIDVDDFKALNQRVGHAGGDQVLCNIADILRDFAPQGGMVARMSGEEFALMVPLELAEQASPVTLIDALSAAHMPQGLKLAVSIGVAEGAIITDDDWTSLYSRADRALYRAKRDGGGRFRIDMSDPE